LAVTVAASLLIAAGFAHRSLAVLLDRHDDTLSLAPGLLAALPLEIGEWRGRDVPLDAAILRAADVDDYVYRKYTRRTDGATVDFYLAFGMRARDLAPHRPEVCNPGAGWTMRHVRDVTLDPSTGDHLPARVFIFQAPGRGQVAVLNYYIIDGRVCEDVGLLRSRLWRGQASVRYMARFQVSRGFGADSAEGSTVDVVSDFAADATATVCELVEKLVDEADASES